MKSILAVVQGNLSDFVRNYIKGNVCFFFFFFFFNCVAYYYYVYSQWTK